MTPRRPRGRARGMPERTSSRGRHRRWTRTRRRSPLSWRPHPELVPRCGQEARSDRLPNTPLARGAFDEIDDAADDPGHVEAARLFEGAPTHVAIGVAPCHQVERRRDATNVAGLAE